MENVPFATASAVVCDRISNYLSRLPEWLAADAQEIRLRVNKPVSICCGGSVYFLHRDGSPGRAADRESVTASRQDVEETFRRVCGDSVYSHQNEIKNGYITVRGGHRVGVCGTAVVAGGAVAALRDISSLNIRIAREISGCADGLLREIGEEIGGGLLLAGPPSGGKTTLLRDIARQLSSGFGGRIWKVAVVDERGELAGTCLGVAQNDLGLCCDVLDGYPKGEGIQQAVRSLSPEFIICDELGAQTDAEAVLEGLNAGVSMVASIHAGSVQELLRRNQALCLLRTGAFGNVAFLGGRAAPGEITGIYKVGDLLNEIDRDRHYSGGVRYGGVYGIA